MADFDVAEALGADKLSHGKFLMHGTSFKGAVGPAINRVFSSNTLSENELIAITLAVDPDHILLFTKRLVDRARKRRRDPPRAMSNRRHLELARLCIDRALADHAGIFAMGGFA